MNDFAEFLMLQNAIQYTTLFAMYYCKAEIFFQEYNQATAYAMERDFPQNSSWR